MDQSSCTLSLSSTLTQCTSLGTATVQHKKITRDSDCDSRFYSPTNMQQQVVGDMDEELFNQLFKARLGHPPYGKFKSWCDIALWEEIVKELRRHNPCNNPTITDALTIVIKYHKEYKKDPDLFQMRLSQSLRLNIRQVFDSVSDRYGSLTFDAIETVYCIVRPESSPSGETVEYKNYAQALEEFFNEKARKILPSTSDRRGIREFKKEKGFIGLLALQYGEDLAALEISDDEKAWLILNFSADSVQYVSVANQAPQTRLSVFRRILHEACNTKDETKSSSHQSSNAKFSKRRKEPRINSYVHISFAKSIF